MSAVLEPRRSRKHWIAGGVAAALTLLVVPPLLGLGWASIVLGLAVLACATVLVPLGLVIQLMLVGRRRTATEVARTLDGELRSDERRGAEFRFGVQRAERTLNISLLVLLPLTIIAWALAGWTGSVNSTPDAEAELEVLRSILVTITIGCLGAIVAAIPVSAVLATRRLVNRSLLVGEAYALTTGIGQAGTVRRSRLLGWIVLLLSVAACATALVVLTSPA